MSNHWELYSDDPQFEEASADLDRAWAFAKTIEPGLLPRERAKLAEQHVFRVLEHWVLLGGLDTEPVEHLRALVRRHFGCEGGWL